MYLELRDVGKVLICVMLLAIFACVARDGVESGWLATSDQKPRGLFVPSQVMVEVQADGSSIITEVKHAPERVKDLIGKPFASPDALEEEVSATEAPESVALPAWLTRIIEFFGIKPAEAHAVNICTHSDGKVSNQTGGGRHLTKFRFHDNGRHYTRTDHQVLTQFGYQTTDIFYFDVSRSYCNCW